MAHPRGLTNFLDAPERVARSSRRAIQNLEDARAANPDSAAEYDSLRGQQNGIYIGFSNLWDERYELSNRIVLARSALESCEQDCPKTFEIINVLSLDGNNAYDPASPLSFDGTGNISLNFAEVIVFNGRAVPTRKLSKATDPGFCSNDEHYHGSAVTCDGNTVVCPMENCGCGKVEDAVFLPCARP